MALCLTQEYLWKRPYWLLKIIYRSITNPCFNQLAYNKLFGKVVYSTRLYQKNATGYPLVVGQVY